jgi:hypothetical protein
LYYLLPLTCTVHKNGFISGVLSDTVAAGQLSKHSWYIRYLQRSFAAPRSFELQPSEKSSIEEDLFAFGIVNPVHYQGLLWHPSYSLNRLARDLLPLATMGVRGETKGISIRGNPYACCSFSLDGLVPALRNIHISHLAFKTIYTSHIVTQQ